MKKSSLLVVLICISQLISAQIKQQPVVSKIEKVILYTSGGQVNRTAKASLPAGKTELLFAGISPDIDKQSIQVKGKGKFTILSVNHQVNYLNEQTRREEVDKLDVQRDAIQQKIIQETNTQQVYKNEEAMLLKNQAIGGANTGLKTVDLKEAIDFQRSRLTEVYLKLAEIARNLKRLDSTNTKIILQQRQLISPENYATSEIIVTVQATAALSAEFEVSYFVKKAGWFATYDLNVKDISSPVELGFKANVFQSSGEDWKDVKLTISNGNPTENSIAPVLQPWSLRFGYNPPPGRTNLRRNEVHGRVTDSKDGSPVSGTSVFVKGSNIGTVTDANGNYSLQIPANATTLKFDEIGYLSLEAPITGAVMNIALTQDTESLSEVVVTGYSSRDGFDEDNKSFPGKTKRREEKSLSLETTVSNRPTTVNFEIELPYTILNNGKVYQVDIKTMTVPAEYQYFAVPKIDKEAFLTAKLANWQELNLLEGEINLFFEGAFLGKSILDLGNATDTLNISLGRDKSITVERKKLKEFSSRQFLSSNKTDNMAYEIVVRNNKPLPINIVIQDQFPVSTTKEISVDEQESSGAQIDPDTRLLTWKYQLEPKQEKKHLLKYSVKYPKSQVLVLE